MNKRIFMYLTSGLKADTIYYVEYHIQGTDAHMIESGKNIIINGEYIKFKGTSIKVHHSKISKFEIRE